LSECTGRHRERREDRISEGFYGSSARRALRRCRDCTGELYLEFRKKTELLNVL
jgi:hypothetical protein